MRATDLISALGLPPESRLDKRVPKATLAERAAVTPADKRLLTHAIEACHWVAVLKPTTVAVPETPAPVHLPAPGSAHPHAAAMAITELSVLSVQLRASEVSTATKRERLLALLHRAIPYPLVLIAEAVPAPSGGDADASPEDNPQPSFAAFSVAFKRPAERAADPSQTLVLSGEPVTVAWPAPPASAPQAMPVRGRRALTVRARTEASPHSMAGLDAAFLTSLALPQLPREHLHALYRGLVVRIEALLAARITGDFSLPPDDAATDARRDALVTHARVVREMAALRVEATRATQMAQRAALNDTLQRLEAQRLEAARHL